MRSRSAITITAGPVDIRFFTPPLSRSNVYAQVLMQLRYYRGAICRSRPARDKYREHDAFGKPASIFYQLML